MDAIGANPLSQVAAAYQGVQGVGAAQETQAVSALQAPAGASSEATTALEAIQVPVDDQRGQLVNIVV